MSEWNSAQAILDKVGKTAYDFCLTHVKDLNLLGHKQVSPREGTRILRRIFADSTKCPECLKVSWKHRFLSEINGVEGGTLESRLRKRAALKARYPGYPPEFAAFGKYRFVEDFVLKKGESFFVSSLSHQELDMVQSIQREIPRRYGENGPSGTKHIVVGRNWKNSFAWSQYAWERSAGLLHYVEGFTMGRSDGPIAFRAWNVLHGKIVDLVDSSYGNALTAYYGVILDSQLKNQLDSLRAKRTIGLREALEKEHGKDARLDFNALPMVYGYIILRQFLGPPFVKLMWDSENAPAHAP